MDRICRIILNIHYDTGGLSRARLARRFADLVERHFETGSLFEVIWLLYTIRGLKTPFKSTRVMERAEVTPSSAIRLILLDMRDKEICISKTPVSTWENEVSEERSLSDWSWLYAYEAIRKGWMGDPKGLLTKPFFKHMHERDIVFYDPDKNIMKSRALKKQQIQSRKTDNAKVITFLKALRKLTPDDEYDWTDY